MKNAILLVSVLLGFGCQDSQSNPSERQFVPANLAFAGDISCDVLDIPAPDVCGWAHRSDAVVVGTLVTIEPILDYLVRDAPPADPDLMPKDSSCDDGRILYGAILHIDVTDTLYGEVPTALKVRVGQEDFSRNWLQSPTFSAGSLEWLPNGDPLPLGATIGLPIVYSDDPGVWSLAGDMPFSFSEAGDVIFVNQEACVYKPPTLSSPTFWTLASALAECNVMKSDMYRGMLPPDQVYASTCYVEPD